MFGFGTGAPCAYGILYLVPAEQSEEPESEYTSFEAGRVCSWPSCDTVLSIYNEFDRCNRHPHRKVLVHPEEPKNRRRTPKRTGF